MFEKILPKWVNKWKRRGEKVGLPEVEVLDDKISNRDELREMVPDLIPSRLDEFEVLSIETQQAILENLKIKIEVEKISRKDLLAPAIFLIMNGHKLNKLTTENSADTTYNARPHPTAEDIKLQIETKFEEMEAASRADYYEKTIENDRKNNKPLERIH